MGSVILPLLHVCLVVCFGSFIHHVDSHFSNDPLFLTPYLESGRIEEAQQKSRVSPDIHGVRSYTGFFTVDKLCGNNLFFWFVPAEVRWTEAPLMLWLTGGPGTSSMVGFFLEVGPFRYVNKSRTLVKNEHRWTKDFNVIFLDQPVGTGFSFTKKGCYVKTNVEMAKQVYSALEQFFILFPILKNNSLFLVGDSYAGTYQPAVAVEIDKRNCEGKMKMNLKGVLLGNPYIDLSCHNYAPYWFETGIVDEESSKVIYEYVNIRNKYIRENNSIKANEYEQRIWNEFYSFPSIFNILWNKEITLDFKHFLNDRLTREWIKVGDVTYNVTSYYGIVAEMFASELIVPATPNVEYLLAKDYLVGFYTGLLDPDCTYSSLVCVLDHLNYSAYQKAKRQPWYVNGQLAGSITQGGKLATFLVRNSGHLVPMDQGEVALDMVKRVIGCEH